MVTSKRLRGRVLGLACIAFCAAARLLSAQEFPGPAPLPQADALEIQRLFAPGAVNQPGGPPTDEELLRALAQPLPKAGPAELAGQAAQPLNAEALTDTWRQDTLTAEDRRGAKEFFGLTPGQSTIADALRHEKWGEATAERYVAADLKAHEYRMAPWKKVTVVTYGDVVHVLLMEAEPADYSPEQAAAAFQLGRLRLLPGDRAGAGDAGAETAVYSSTTHHAFLIFRRIDGRLKFTQLVLSFGNDLMAALALEPGPAAEAVLREGVARRGRLWQLRLLHALSLAQQQRFDEAVAECSAAIDMLPNEQADQPRFVLGSLYYLAGRNRDAVDLFTRLLEKDSQNLHAYRARGEVLANLGEHERALTDYRAYLAHDINQPDVLNNSAWLMATSPHDALRNGPLAVRLAMRAVQMTEEKQPHILSTLAAALAETGDFDAAIAWAAKAEELTTGEVRSQMHAELESYRQRKPWRISIPPRQEAPR
jgi:tetratricopeptide (TPR) repeat protein